MDDGYYRRKAVLHHDGGYALWADALAAPIPPYYPPIWFCTHDDGEYHQTVEEALTCPQYEEFMRQVR
jgi:hypothetical protein